MGEIDLSQYNVSSDRDKLLEGLRRVKDFSPSELRDYHTQYFLGLLNVKTQYEILQQHAKKSQDELEAQRWAFKEQNAFSKKQLWRTTVLVIGTVVATIAAIIFGGISYYYSDRQFQLNLAQYNEMMRPYLTLAIDSNEQEIMSFVETDGSTTTFRFLFTIQNVGELPANFAIEKIDFSPFNLKPASIIPIFPDKGVLAPKQKLDVGWFLSVPNKLVADFSEFKPVIRIRYGKNGPDSVKDYYIDIEGVTVSPDNFKKANYMSVIRWKVGNGN
ncbi:MAG: hypothetical protein A3C90_04745 [Candidatus Magasanikbacteria bacterium RIFCSPHIGHO2_02_FULL_51_14]|uniref:Uncharacterized protein n=1 Tax=Candidatus Magasanikbacteria bacterium RIFCSPHIGHO2_02_FULL_51_14 TaxID=1798683 RepID=A0A1F6MQF0_9BACT|nr:MAG: hypothetical protein A3C90_04745 [Candidatus Magasanikbacteria bacterium RIFCSPHIGHO2_02_FULL_51_14]